MRVAAEEGVSEDLTQDSANTEANDLSGTQVTEEEKEVASDTSKKPSDIFKTTTGASQVAGMSKEDVTQQEDQDRYNREP